MKMTEQLQKEILKMYEAFWHSLLNVDIGVYDSVLDVDYRLIGTTENEVFFNKQEAIRFLKATADQLAGNLERRESKIKLEAVDRLVLITEQFDAYVLIDGDWTFYGKARVSTWLQLQPQGWKIVQQHFSLPDTKAGEGQTIGLEKIAKENLELRDAIKRRTIELESKNRELEKEAALERVRSTSLAMYTAQDLSKVVYVVFTELVKLDAKLDRCLILTVNPQTLGITLYLTGKEGLLSNNGFLVPNNQLPSHQAYLEGWRTKRKKWRYLLAGEEKKLVDEYVFSETELAQLPDFIKADMAAVESIHLTISSDDFGCLIASSLVPLSEAHAEIVDRFTTVFNQTFTRFLDLQKAEAQAREAQIETVLERVRSRTLGMQKSGELREVIQVIFEQFQNLGIDLYGAAFAMDYMESEDWFIWSADIANLSPTLLHIPYFDHPYWNSWNDARRIGLDSLTYTMELEEKNNFVSEFAKYIPDLSAEVFQSVLSTPGYTVSNVFLKNVTLYIDRFNTEPFSDADNAILMRFGKVFEQTYTRFKDLEKAEAQAREAQIEAALERVRSRSIEMRNSIELKEVVKEVFIKMKELGFSQNNSVMIVLPKNGFKDTLHWTFNENFETTEYFIPAFNHQVSTGAYNTWKNGKKVFEINIDKVEKDKFLDLIFTETDYAKVPVEFKNYLYSTEAYSQILVFEEHCGLLVDTFSPVTYTAAQKDVIIRFARAFEQAYTRFLDLQKAEAQAREAQIEAALERVRSRTMAMQRSEELPEVAALLFQQVKTLGVPQFHCGFNIFEIDDKECIWYPGTADGDILPPCKIPLTEHPVFMNFIESRKRGDELCVYEKEGEYQAGHYRYMLSLPVLGEILQNMLDAGIPFPTFQIDHLANFSHGNLLFITSEHFPEMHDTFKRFARVFEQTYTRFLDLQKAEAQAREAQVEVALERIRAKALSMQSSTELSEVAKVLRDQMGILGQEDLEASVVHLYSEGSPTFDSWYAFRAGDQILQGQATFRFENSALAKEFLKLYEDEVTEYTIEVKGQKLKEWLAEIKRNAPKIAAYWGDLPPEKQFYHFSDFSGGALLMVSHQNLSEETRMLQKRCASVFELAYKRFLDLEAKERQERELLEEKLRLEKALSELKSTQAQLIQSEKMASLGELTAGIAHEIQNPLNFVNNFSEVSAELVEEMKEELAVGNSQLAVEIAEDIKQNLEKITLHGKRADAIVKGMLEHSKRGSGQKELTDINALADEFLRMTYQSFLAKDANFKVELKTEFDPNLPKVTVIPQDIGKVLLNLYSNAFYACAERSRSFGTSSFDVQHSTIDIQNQPKVTVSTKTLGDKIEISVKDNGSGIPQNIVDKIFQPFFTTKPTGSGTGLGLSLSYDIVKAHGGEIRVESQAGTGTDFIIHLPMSNQ